MGTAAKRLKTARTRRQRVAVIFNLLEKGTLPVEDCILGETELANHTGATAPHRLVLLDRVDLWDVLRRAPNLGPKGVKKICTTTGIWPHTRMGDLDDEQRRAIIDALPPRARKHS